LAVKVTHGALTLTTLACILITPAMGARIDLLAIGQVDPSYSPISAFAQIEPSMSGTLVVSRSIHAGIFTRDELRRFVRIYMPRTFRDLLEYEYIVFDQPILSHFENLQIGWMYRALSEEGVGSLGFTQSGNAEMYEPWMNSGLQELFPHDQERFIAGGMDSIEPYSLEISDDRSLPPVIWPFEALGIEKVQPFGYTRALFKKEGATEWARATAIPAFAGLGFTSCPLLLSWEYGEGKSRIWATGDQFVSPMWGSWWGGDGQERFSLDIFVNIAWYACGWDIPSDPVIVHQLRNQFAEYKIRFGNLYALLDFIENFGASSRTLQGDISEIENLKAGVDDRYLSQEFDSAASSMQEVFTLITELESRAVEIKENALLWVYIVEWLSVTGVLVITGFLTWTLMVRRRLYRDIETTRSRTR